MSVAMVMEKSNPPPQNSGDTLTLCLVLLAILLAAAFHTWQLVEDGRQLTSVSASQEKQVTEAKKMRDQLEVLAVRTLLLANQGDVPAQAIVDTLRKQGVNIQLPK